MFFPPSSLNRRNDTRGRGGKSKVEASREETIEKLRAEREQRKRVKLENKSSVTIQARAVLSGQQLLRGRVRLRLTGLLFRCARLAGLLARLVLKVGNQEALQGDLDKRIWLRRKPLAARVGGAKALV